MPKASAVRLAQAEYSTRGGPPVERGHPPSGAYACRHRPKPTQI